MVQVDITSRLQVRAEAQREERGVSVYVDEGNPNTYINGGLD